MSRFQKYLESERENTKYLKETPLDVYDIELFRNIFCT